MGKGGSQSRKRGLVGTEGSTDSSLLGFSLGPHHLPICLSTQPSIHHVPLTLYLCKGHLHPASRASFQLRVWH